MGQVKRQLFCGNIAFVICYHKPYNEALCAKYYVYYFGI